MVIKKIVKIISLYSY